MDAFKTDKASYTPEDFKIWQAGEILEITPKFQRRSVWSTPIRSYFIDTLLREMTVPPIYLRIGQNDSKTKTIREVVDGQQRIRSVLDFMDGKFRLSKTLGMSWAKKKFKDLTDEQRHQITHFSFSCEVFRGISDAQVLEVFCRLNVNGIPLNKQELRNGKYFGLFKQSSFRLALAYLEFWRNHDIFTERSIARMLEVELTSELLIAGHAGMQDKKESLNRFYAKWEDDYPEQQRDEKRFEEVLETISETFTDDSLSDSAFSRPPLFYILYCVIYHRLFGLPDVLRQTPRKRLSADDRESLLEAVIKLSDIIVQSKDPANETPKRYVAFVQAGSAQTDNIKPRQTLFNTLYETAF